MIRLSLPDRERIPDDMLYLTNQMNQNAKNVVFQRKHLRVHTDLKARFSILFSGTRPKSLPTEVKMLGCGGLMLISSIPLVKGTRLEIELFHDRHKIPFTAEVVWTRNGLLAGTESLHCGLRFLNISQESILHVHQILYSRLFKTKHSSRRTKRIARTPSNG